MGQRSGQALYRRLGQGVLHPVVLAIVIVIVNVVLGLVVLPNLGEALSDNQTWIQATERDFSRVGLYSPLPTLIMIAWQSVLGTDNLSAFGFQFVCFAVGLIFIWLTARRLFKNPSIAPLTVYLTIFSPYLIWSVYVGRSVALDIMAVSFLMFFVARFYEHPNLRDAIAAGLAAAFATMIRESSGIILPMFLLLALIFRCGTVRQLVVGGVIFLAGISPLLIYNYANLHTITISTRMGYNLAIGSHPFYLDGHPNYDIDVFLRYRLRHDIEEAVENVDDTNRVQLDADYRNYAIQNMLSDPMGTAYRTLLKAYWWVGLTRIPQSDAVAQLSPTEDTVVIDEQASVFKDLLYVIHRLILIGFGLVYFKSRGFSARLAILLLTPMLSIMLIAMATFPDTRFRLAEDPYTYMLAAAGIAVIPAMIPRKREAQTASARAT